ncbi:ATP-binding Cassette (ABC) Superfamily, partial [Thraustotheca clavata]
MNNFECKSMLHRNNVVLSPSIISPSFENAFCTPFDDNTLEVYDEASTSGTLVFQEKRSHGRVSTRIFSAYLHAVGGWPKFCFWVVVISLWQILSIMGDFWLSKWTMTAENGSDARFLEQTPAFLGMYALFALSGVFFTVLRTTSILLSGLRASKELFNDMTKALFQAPMAFFDANPIGRILNRYSNDIVTIDTIIPMTLNSFLAMVFVAIFCLITTIATTKLLGLLLAPIVIIYFRVGQTYVNPAREVERVNKVTKSPLLNLMSEAIDGVLVIRAFGSHHVKRFEALHHRNVDCNLEAVFASQVIMQWFSLRIQLTTTLLLFVSSFSLVCARAYLSPGIIGLVLNYTFAVLPFFEWIVTSWSQIETAMVGPERVAEYAAIESEAPRVISGATAYDWPTTGHITFSN